AYNKSKLQRHFVNLEFEVDGELYSISRPFDDPFRVFYSKGNTSRKEYKLNYVQNILFDLIFKREDYAGYYEQSWYRDLMNFFVKIQKVSGDKFLNPVRFTNSRELLLIQYHLFLLNINNDVASENFNLLNQLDNYKNTIKTTKQILAEHFSLSDLASVHQQITKLSNDIKKLSNIISSFRLSEEFEDIQYDLDLLTAEIKSLSFLNSSDRNKVNNYKASIKIESNFSTDRVKQIYDEVNSLLGSAIQKSLEEAKEFRISLVASRKDFIKKETQNLEWRIKRRADIIKEKEDKRSAILNMLSKRAALGDLTSAYERLNTLTNKKSELESKLELYKYSAKKIDGIENSVGKLSQFVTELVKENEDYINDFTELLNNIYKNVFGVDGSANSFTVASQDKPQKIKLDVLPDDIYSHGKNQGRTLIYDLAVLFNMIENNIKGPRFIVHDSIFDSLDKTHLKSLYSYCNKLDEDGTRFQYIVTLNHHSDLHEEILNKTKLEIYASKRLLGEKF
ncbi:MAG: DUF2326 domain-containing protein, partial [Ignavibacteria bacterium]